MTHADTINADLLAFLKQNSKERGQIQKLPVRLLLSLCPGSFGSYPGQISLFMGPRAAGSAGEATVHSQPR